MMKTSIKREQSQAGLSFAERKNRRSLAGGESNFRPKVKNKLLLLLALLMTAATGAWGQTVVTIGNGTDTSPFVPYNSSFNNSLEEQIYLASEIGQSGIITAISFNSADDETYNETINVYMKNVTRSSFSSTTDYEPLAASDIVFSGSVTFGKGWKTVTLDTPFEYDNTKNLLICFYKKGSTSYSIYNTYTTQAENRTIAFYHDTNVPDPYNLGSYPKFIKLSATRANIKITIEAGGGSGSEEGSTYTVSLKDGVKDADKWTITPNPAEEGQTVTLTYNGRLKVKGVKATSDAGAPATPASLIANPVVGQIIGSDGKNYDANATLPTGVTKVAKICYVGSETGEAAPYNHGLALALSDANDGDPCTWMTSNTDAGHTKQASYIFTEESGLQYNDTHNSDTYPAFKAAIANNGTAAPTGCSSWFLPSGYQWKKMIGAAGLDNLGLTWGGYYWSSSEYDADNAWDFDSYEGIWYNSNKYSNDQVRACLAF